MKTAEPLCGYNNRYDASKLGVLVSFVSWNAKLKRRESHFQENCCLHYNKLIESEFLICTNNCFECFGRLRGLGRGSIVVEH